MQRVPADAQAGPVLPKVATRAPRALTKAEKPAAAKAEDLQAQELQKKAGRHRPAVGRQAGSHRRRKGAGGQAGRQADGCRRAPSRPPRQPQRPRLAKPQPTKVADAKPMAVKTAAKPAKDAIPGLRLSANAY